MKPTTISTTEIMMNKALTVCQITSMIAPNIYCPFEKGGAIASPAVGFG